MTGQQLPVRTGRFLRTAVAYLPCSGGSSKSLLTSSIMRLGEYINSDPKWVKVVTPGGAVHHVDWSTQYAALQEAAQLPSEG